MTRDRLTNCLAIMLMGLGAAGWFTGCNPRDLTISVTDRAYVAPPKPKVEAKPETPPPPTDIVREAEVAPPQQALAAASAARDLGDVYFDYDRYDIRSDDKSVLDAAIGILKTEKERKLVIEGHCDERGTNEYNLILGERRAKAVKQHLVKSGISGSRIHPTSYGKERPVCLEHLPGCWKKNRRAHLVLE